MNAKEPYNPELLLTRLRKCRRQGAQRLSELLRASVDKFELHEGGI